MSVSVGIPRRLYEEAVRRGIDVESRIIELLAKDLGLDPKDEAPLHLELAERFMSEGMELLRRGDTIQASEKLYKAVEECIKALACLEGLEECRRARDEGGWRTKLLSRAARKLSLRLGEGLILEAWSQGYDLHVHGFHEHGLGVEEVRESLPVVERFVNYVENVLRDRVGGSRKASM